MSRPIKIFINYRTADNRYFVELIRTWLIMRYGRDNVFMDFDSLPHFTQFEDFIRSKIAECDVVLSIIGPRWLELIDAKVAQGETDYVLLEIEEALEHGKLLAPVLILDAAVPPNDRVPPAVRPMFKQHLARLRDGREVIDKIHKLMDDIEAELVRRGFEPIIYAATQNAADKDLREAVQPTRVQTSDSQAIYQRFVASFNAGHWDAALVWASQLTVGDNTLPPHIVERVQGMESQAREEIARENERLRQLEAAAYLYSFVQAEAAAGSRPQEINQLLQDVWDVLPGYDPDRLALQPEEPQGVITESKPKQLRHI